MNQTVENQALERFHLAYLAYLPKMSLPTLRPTQPTWHDFCRQDPQQFYTFNYMLNMLNKNLKTLENQGLASFSKSLASF